MVPVAQQALPRCNEVESREPVRNFVCERWPHSSRQQTPKDKWNSEGCLKARRYNASGEAHDTQLNNSPLLPIAAAKRLRLLYHDPPPAAIERVADTVTGVLQRPSIPLRCIEATVAICACRAVLPGGAALHQPCPSTAPAASKRSLDATKWNRGSPSEILCADGEPYCHRHAFAKMRPWPSLIPRRANRHHHASARRLRALLTEDGDGLSSRSRRALCWWRNWRSVCRGLCSRGCRAG